MKIVKMAIPFMIATAALGTAITADAATGIVNLNTVLANNAEFQKAAKAYAQEEDKLQKDFDNKSKNMTNAQKEKLLNEYRQQLAQKDRELIQPIQKKLDDVVAKVAKEKKIDTVVVPGGFVYGEISVDLTEDVQKAMN